MKNRTLAALALVLAFLAIPAEAQVLRAQTGTFFLTAVDACVAVSSTTGPVVVRNAANDWVLARTAAGAETISFRCDLGSALMSRGLISETTGSGIRIRSIAISQKITVAAATSNTLNKISKTTYAAGAANSVADFGGTLTATMPTATAATPYLTSVTLGTPAYFSGTAALGVDWTVVLANTGVYELAGIQVNYSKNP